MKIIDPETGEEMEVNPDLAIWGVLGFGIFLGVLLCALFGCHF